jgi:hypothetical protein
MLTFDLHLLLSLKHLALNVNHVVPQGLVPLKLLEGFLDLRLRLNRFIDLLQFNLAVVNLLVQPLVQDLQPDYLAVTVLVFSV